MADNTRITPGWYWKSRSVGSSTVADHHQHLRRIEGGESGSAILNEFRAAMEARRQGRSRAPGPQQGQQGRSRAPGPQQGQQGRMYANARVNRYTVGFGSSGSASADAELQTSLPMLRARSRQMVRDSSYAKRAKTVVVNNVIGGGVGLQAQVMTTRGKPATRINDAIETVYREWMSAANCHTGGAFHFSDLERAAMGQVFEAGEVFIRMHYARFGASKVPLALELVEAERVPVDHHMTPGPEAGAAEVRMGVEVDKFGRALAYWIRERHPGDIRAIGSVTDRYERVPAAEVFHLRLVHRWPQTRGEPWMHTALKKLDDINEYSGSELMAARAQAMVFATIETPAGDTGPLSDEEEEDGQQAMNIEPLMVQALAPGEQLKHHAPTRPNVALDPFIRYMLREVASGTGPSYESISRDYSQSNYSSSRLALLEDRDLWRMLQVWWVCNFRQPLHRVWLQQAVLADAVPALQVVQYAADIDRYQAARFKTRGWSWVDPTKEVTAYKEAIKGGLTTLTDVIAQTAGGLDIEDVIATRQREQQLLRDAGIEVDTTVHAAPAAPPAPAPAPVPEDPPDDDEDEDPGDKPAKQLHDPHLRVVSFWGT